LLPMKKTTKKKVLAYAFELRYEEKRGWGKGGKKSTAAKLGVNMS